MSGYHIAVHGHVYGYRSVNTSGIACGYGVLPRVRNHFLGILNVRPQYVGEHEPGNNFDLFTWRLPSVGIYQDIMGISPQQWRIKWKMKWDHFTGFYNKD